MLVFIERVKCCTPRRSVNTNKLEDRCLHHYAICTIAHVSVERLRCEMSIGATLIYKPNMSTLSRGIMNINHHTELTLKSCLRREKILSKRRFRPSFWPAGRNNTTYTLEGKRDGDVSYQGRSYTTRAKQRTDCGRNYRP